MSFVPAVERISPDETGGIPGLGSLIRYWTLDARSPEEWLREVADHRGAGLAMRRGDEVLGIALYGPPECLPRARRCSVGPLDPEAALLAYVGGDSRTRRHLLVRALKEMRHQGVERVEAVSSDAGHSWHLPTGFLLENGWRPVRRGWYRGRPYTLMQVDLGSTVEVGELARGLIEKVRLPRLKPNAPAPGAFVRAEPPQDHFRAEAPRS